jgi:hypothetical protein
MKGLEILQLFSGIWILECEGTVFHWNLWNWLCIGAISYWRRAEPSKCAYHITLVTVYDVCLGDWFWKHVWSESMLLYPPSPKKLLPLSSHLAHFRFACFDVCTLPCCHGFVEQKKLMECKNLYHHSEGRWEDRTKFLTNKVYLLCGFRSWTQLNWWVLYNVLLLKCTWLCVMGDYWNHSHDYLVGLKE